MNPAQMREAILKVRPLWRDKVNKMPDRQVAAIYMRMLNNKEIK